METARIIAETKRLTIRLMTEPDVSALASIWTDPQITRFMGGPRIFEELCSGFAQDLETPPPKFDLWPVAEKNSGTIIGHCGLLPKTIDGCGEVELVYVIAPVF